MFMGVINSASHVRLTCLEILERSHTEIKTLQTCACCSSMVLGKEGLERCLVVGTSIHKLGIYLVQEAGNW